MIPGTAEMKPGQAEIHLASPEWQGVFPHLILRAAHHLAEYHGIRTIFLDVPEVPAAVRDLWNASLRFRKRAISIDCDPARHIAGRTFAAPDFAMYTASGEVLLGIPEIPELTDFHVHTRLAYCSENMDVAMAVELERLSGVKHVHFSEHSGQLYSPEDTYWGNEFFWRAREEKFNRTSQYESLIRESPPALFGLELDVDADAVVADFRSPVLNGYRIGAVHFLEKDLDYEGKKTDFLRRLDALLKSGIDILAHPFRVFRKGGLPIPKELFEPVAQRLAAAKVAAEINFHTNIPQAEFVELVLKKGGKISFGTDSHNLYEAGYFRPHYEFCRQLGIAGKLDVYLVHPGCGGRLQ